MILFTVRNAVALTMAFLASGITTIFATKIRGWDTGSEFRGADAGRRDLSFGIFREHKCGKGLLGIFGHKKKIHLVSDTGSCKELCTQSWLPKRVNRGNWDCGPCATEVKAFSVSF